MNKMTKREKVLISILVFIASVYALGNFIVLPAYTNVTTKTEQLSDLKLAQTEAKLTLGSKESVEQRLADLTEKQGENREFYSEPMVNEDIDRLITSMAVDSGILASRLNIEDAEVTEEIDSVLDIKTVSFYGDGSINEFNSFIDKVNALPYVSSASVRVSSAGSTVYSPTQPMTPDEPVLENSLVFVFNIYMMP